MQGHHLCQSKTRQRDILNGDLFELLAKAGSMTPPTTICTGEHVSGNEVWEGSQHKAHVPYKEVH
jgi:hypothetical protein